MGAHHAPAGKNAEDAVRAPLTHHAPAGSYKAALARFAPRYVLGVTATPYRNDKLKLLNVFEKNVYTKTILDLIEAGYLTNVAIRTLPVKIDLSQVRVKQGDFSEDDLGAALDPMIAELAAIVATEYSSRKLLTFCPLRETSKRWTQALLDHGLPAAHVDGDSPDRKQILNAYSRGDIRFLSNASLLTEGYDEPSIDTILILRPTKSRALYSQMIGRGTRLFKDKDRLLVLDPVFLSERHNILSVADLVAEDGETSTAIGELMENRGIGLKEAAGLNASLQRAKLAAALETASGREGYERSLADLCLNLDHPALKNWKPASGWQAEPPTASQLSVIARAGIAPFLVGSKGFASEIIDRLVTRRQLGRATVKQVQFLRKAGHRNPEALSFEAASALIEQHKISRLAKTA